MVKTVPVTLIDEGDTRVTHAAVLLRPGQEPLYLVAKGRNGSPPAGFQFYDDAVHRPKHSGGKLCCGNCLEKEGREVAVHHRAATAPRIAGGDQPGHRATFAANPDTVDEHTDYCKSRRLTGAKAAFQQPDVKFHINVDWLYTGTRPPQSAYAAKFSQAGQSVRKLEARDARLLDREPLAVNRDIREFLSAAGGLTRRQAQTAMYVIDGGIGTHQNTFIDGNGWKTLWDTMVRRGSALQAPRIFHLCNPKNVPRQDFISAAMDRPEDEIKVPMRQYEFKDASGHHIMQPSIVTSHPEVKAMLEIAGDFLVLGRFKHQQVFARSRGGPLIHQIQIEVNNSAQLVKLYRDGRKVRDLNVMEHLQQDSGPVSEVKPAGARPAPALKNRSVAGQPDLFAAPV